LRFRTPRTPIKRSPMASDVRVVGSGTGVTPTTPATVIPGVVPNEKVAPVTVVVEVIDAFVIVKIAV
jgi:hypothetical protein